MNRTINIGDIPVPMTSTAVVDYAYKAIFHEDPVKLQMEELANDISKAVDFFVRMGYVMAMNASMPFREMKNLSEDDFIEWLGQFDRAAVYDAFEDIRAVYEGQDIQSSVEKKRAEEPSVE